MRPSVRFVRSIEQVILWLRNFIIGYVLGKIFEFTVKKSWVIVRPRFFQFVSRLTWFFPAGIFTLTLQVLTGLGYAHPPTTFVRILDQAIFVIVTEIGLILTGLGLSMGGPRRSFVGIQIIGSVKNKVRVVRNHGRN